MRTSPLNSRKPWSGRLYLLMVFSLWAALGAQADIVYNLHATSQAGDIFDGSLTVDTTPTPPNDPYPFTNFTGQITETNASGAFLDTYVPDESDVEGSVRRYLFAEASNYYGALYLFVDGSTFSTSPTVCTTTHVCDCMPAATCPYPDPGDTFSAAHRCTDLDPPNLPYGCFAFDDQDLKTATLTSVPMSPTPEPNSLVLLTTGALASSTTLLRRRRLQRESPKPAR